MPSRFKRMAVEMTKTVAATPYRRQVAATATLSEDAFWELQGRLLRERYTDAVTRVPYYGKEGYPSELNWKAGPVSALQELPILSKSAVKREPEAFWRRPLNRLAFTHTTGGTTGAPLRIRSATRNRGKTEAILGGRYEQIGVSRRPRIVRLSGYLGDATERGTVWQRIPGTKVAYLSIYHLTPAHREEIVKRITKFRPQVFHGYASALTELANLFDSDELAELDFRVVSTSETLYDEQRQLIERNLHTTVHNEYGSQEGQHLALECAHGMMHIHPLRGIIEVLEFDSDRPALPGELGRVIVTGVQAREMPLIRYDIGDSAYSTGYASGCACGQSWPTIGQVVGRTEDLVRTRDGRQIGLLSHSTLKDVDGIIEAQIRQKGFEDFVYRIRPDVNYRRETAEAHVRRELTNRIGYPVNVTFDYVEVLERTSAGKLRAVVVDFDPVTSS